MSLRRLVCAALLVVTALATERRAFADEQTAEDVIAQNRRNRPAPWKTSAAFTVAGGAAALGLLDLHFYGVQAIAGASAEATEHVSVGADVQYARAETPNGLLLQLGRLDFTPALVLDGIRLGLGPHLTWLVITRETGGDAIKRLGFGLHAIASVDILHLGERGGLFLAVKPSIAKVGPTALREIDVALGIRF
jgi:hypothetical protein